MAVTKVSAVSVQSVIYICGAASLVLLPKIDAVLAQVSLTMLVFLAVGHVITKRFSEKEEATAKVPTTRRKMYEQHDYVPPNREWSRRTRYQAMGDGSTGPLKKCNRNLFDRGYIATEDASVTGSCADTPVPKYHELLSTGAAVAQQRKKYGNVIAEADAKRLLERLHELECKMDHRRIADGEKRNTMPRRMAAGIRDAARALQRGRAQAIVIASDAGADSKVADLMAQASWKEVPVMIAFPRTQLGKMIVRADINATVLVILHAEGCEDLFEEVTGTKPYPPRYDPNPSNEVVGEESNVPARARTEPTVAAPNSYPWSARNSEPTVRCVTPPWDQ